MQSGLCLQRPNLKGDTAGVGAGYRRNFSFAPNLVAGAPTGVSPAISKAPSRFLFNTAAFAISRGRQPFGSVGRNTIIGPGDSSIAGRCVWARYIPREGRASACSSAPEFFQCPQSSQLQTWWGRIVNDPTFWTGAEPVRPEAVTVRPESSPSNCPAAVLLISAGETGPSGPAAAGKHRDNYLNLWRSDERTLCAWCYPCFC